MEILLHRVMECALLLLIIGIFFAFARAVRGPRFTDRIVAINMIGTMTSASICILSGYLGQTSLVDVALVYSLLSFLAVVILSHVVTLHHKGRALNLKRKSMQEQTKQEGQQ